MAIEHTKRCSIALAIREMAIKTAMRDHFIPTRMAMKSKITNVVRV